MRYFGEGFGVFVYVHIPKKGVRRLSKEQGVGNGILGKMIPHPGKMRRMWAILMKSGQKCSRKL